MNSGTTTRIGMGIAAGLAGAAVGLHGDASLSRRPMQRVVAPLREMGADIRGREHDGEFVLPVEIRGRPLRPWSGVLPVASAQVKSALLMAGLVAGVDVDVGEPAPSRDHTENFLAAFGYDVSVDAAAHRVALRGTGLRHAGRDLTVAGDPSSAAFWAALAAASGGAAELHGITGNPTRMGFFEALRAMGARVEVSPRRGDHADAPVDVAVGGSLRRGAVIAGDMAVRAIDELPLLALLGVCLPAGEAVEVRDAGELRVKETDRIAAAADIAAAFGARVESGPDWLRVSRGVPAAGPLHVDSRHDHRMAMAAAVLAVATGRETTIAHGDAVAVSYPGFWRELARQSLADVAGAAA